MAAKLLVVIGYLCVLVGLGWLAKRRAVRSTEDYFVASRTLSPWLLLLTMAATNFSAFTVFGFSGAGWRIGYGFFPVMAFGTGFMAVAFYFIGLPVWQLGRRHGHYTPPELIGARFRSKGVRLLVFAVMAVFTLPYLAMQPMAAGYALESLLGLPYYAGAILITVVMLTYTTLGGLRGVAWTDALQGGLMLVLLVVVLGVVVAPHGGLTSANHQVAQHWPELLARPGGGAELTVGVWLGYMLLWLWADPMLPQLFQRCFAAKNPRSLHTTMIMYPVVTAGLFLLPVTIGVVGRLTFPELAAGTDTDRIIPMLLANLAPGTLEALFTTCAVAALMSTLDSQVLTLSSMFTRDVYEPLTGRTAPPWAGRAFVVVLAAGGLAIAWQPPATFQAIATQAFTGLAVLLPATCAALYWSRATAAGAIASIVVGQALVIGYLFGQLPTLGTLPVVPVVLATTLTLVLVSLLTRKHGRPPAFRLSGRKRSWCLWAVVLGVLFFLGTDFWAWEDARTWLGGLPWWVWYFIALNGATVLAFWALKRSRIAPSDTPKHNERRPAPTDPDIPTSRDTSGPP